MNTEEKLLEQLGDIRWRSHAVMWITGTMLMFLAGAFAVEPDFYAEVSEVTAGLVATFVTAWFVR